MGQMKGFLITVHNGGEKAVAAVQRVSEDWRAQLEQAADEIERLRITDEEREAVERAAQWMVQLAKDRGEIHSAGYLVDDAATLRGLLDRTGSE